MTSAPLSDNDRAVLGTLGRAAKPLSAYDILHQTRPGPIKAPVQVYRSLEKLERQGLVHRIEALNAFVACSDHAHQGGRPGFVICRTCGEVREFEDQRLDAIAETAAGPGFEVDLVSLEVLGECAACRGNA
jgi:Fur family transcriptional regulator, zinc uptake regulator